VFTALALVRMLILPLNNFPWVINGLLESKVSLDRIQRFLDLPSYSPEAYYSPGKEGSREESMVNRGIESFFLLF
jgi:ATP-binding cassette subfamily C (CFTR/MRP) protein 10